MRTFHTKVAGVTAKNPNGISRQSYIAKFCRSGMSATLQREPENAFDQNAVAVYITARALLFFKAPVQIGYVNADLAQELARHMDKGGSVTAVVSEVTGGEGRKRNLGINLRVTKA